MPDAPAPPKTPLTKSGGIMSKKVLGMPLPLVAGVLLVAGYLLYRHYKNTSTNTQAAGTGTNPFDPNAIDPNTGVPISQEESAYLAALGGAQPGGGSGTGAGGSGGGLSGSDVADIISAILANQPPPAAPTPTNTTGPGNTTIDFSPTNDFSPAANYYTTYNGGGGPSPNPNPPVVPPDQTPPVSPYVTITPNPNASTGVSAYSGATGGYIPSTPAPSTGTGSTTTGFLTDVTSGTGGAPTVVNSYPNTSKGTPTGASSVPKAPSTAGAQQTVIVGPHGRTPV